MFERSGDKYAIGRPSSVTLIASRPIGLKDLDWIRFLEGEQRLPPVLGLLGHARGEHMGSLGQFFF